MKVDLILLLASVITLSACENNSSSPVSKATEVRISGVVLQEDVSVTHAKIEAKDINGKIVAATTLEGKDRFTINLPAGADYPVILSATPTGQQTTLKAVVTSDLVEEQDISSVTTIVVDTAISLGGVNEANLAKAARAAISQRKTSGGAGSSSGFKGDPTKH